MDASSCKTIQRNLHGKRSFRVRGSLGPMTATHFCGFTISFAKVFALKSANGISLETIEKFEFEAEISFFMILVASQAITKYDAFPQFGGTLPLFQKDFRGNDCFYTSFIPLCVTAESVRMRKAEPFLRGT